MKKKIAKCVECGKVHEANEWAGIEKDMVKKGKGYICNKCKPKKAKEEKKESKKDFFKSDKGSSIG